MMLPWVGGHRWGAVLLALVASLVACGDGQLLAGSSDVEYEQDGGSPDPDLAVAVDAPAAGDSCSRGDLPQQVEGPLNQCAMPATDWVWPVTGTKTLSPWSVTNPLGNSWSSYRGHLGEDYGMGSNLGKPVFAIADGKVVEVDHGIGNYLDIIIVEHCLPNPTSGGDSVLFARYGHCKAAVQEGQVVQKGDRLGTLGNPSPFAPHLHVELVNEAALKQGPFCNGCKAIKVHMSPGYSGYTFKVEGATYHDLKDSISGNRFYKLSAVMSGSGL